MFALESHSLATLPTSCIPYQAKDCELLRDQIDSSQASKLTQHYDRNLGFGDVGKLVEVLSEGAASGQDVGAMQNLLQYEKARQTHVIPMMTAVDTINKLYSTDHPAAVLAQAVALTATDSLSPIRALIVPFAMK